MALSDDKPWRGMFVAKRPEPKELPRCGDRNASLRDLALQQVVESCDDAAAEASLDELLEIADIITMWPRACLPWVLPRLGHRLLFACQQQTELRSLISSELLEAAIRRDEQKFRDASDDKLAAKPGRKYKGDPARAFAAYPLMDVFGEWVKLLGNTEAPAVAPEQLLFAHERAAVAPDLGMRTFEPSFDDFHANFDVFSSGLLRGLSWDGVVAAGGSVLACALRSTVPPAPKRADPDAECAREEKRWSYFAATEHHIFRRYRVADEASVATPFESPFASSSDIDLFLVGLDPSAAYKKCHEVYRVLKRNLRGKVLIVTTGSALTFVAGWPHRNIQVVLKLFPSVCGVLASFDVDCCAFAYNGDKVLCTARGLRAAVTRCNAVDLQRRSVTYESRLLKYAMRGFAIGVSPDVYAKHKLDASKFESSGLLFSKGQTGLRRLLIAEMLANTRRGATRDKHGRVVLAEEGPPVTTREAYNSFVNHYAQKRALAGILPGQVEGRPTEDQTLWNDAYTKVVGYDEYFNLEESKVANDAAAHDKPMYTQGIMPWRLGFDAKRIEEHLIAARTHGEKLREWRREQFNLPTNGVFTISAARHSTLPSEGVTGFGYQLSKLLVQSSFEAAAACGSFFPVPPEGFTAGCHLAEDAASSILYKLVFQAHGDFKKPKGHEWRSKFPVGRIVEAKAETASPMVRCTIVEAEPGKPPPHDYYGQLKLRFDGRDELVEHSSHRVKVISPLHETFRKLVDEKLIPSELLKNRHTFVDVLSPMTHKWLRTRGLELRSALTEAEADKVRPIIDALAGDVVMREHGHDFSLTLCRCEPAASAPAGQASPESLEVLTPLYDYRGVAVGSQVELHGLRLAEYNALRGTVVGPCDEGRYAVEVSPGGTKKRIRVKLDNLRTINI